MRINRKNMNALLGIGLVLSHLGIFSFLTGFLPILGKWSGLIGAPIVIIVEIMFLLNVGFKK